MGQKKRAMAGTLLNLTLVSIAIFAVIVCFLGSHLPGGASSRRTSSRGKEIPRFAALASPRSARLPRCPFIDEPTEATIAGRGKPCKFSVRNTQMDNVELLWVQDNGEERRFFIVDYNSTLSVSSYTGDRWRLRSRRGLLLKEFRTPSCAASASPEVLLSPCAPPTLGPPRAPAAPAAVARRVFSRERLRACGSEHVLSVDHPSPGMHLLCLAALPSSSQQGVAFAVAAFGE